MDGSGSQRRALLAESLALLAVVGLLEVGTRLALWRLAPPALPRLFESPLTTGKYLAFVAHAPQRRPLDVLVMGLSPMLRVDPWLLDESIRERRGTGATTFNFATPLHWVALDRRLLEEVILPVEPPRVIVYGVTPINLLLERTNDATDAVVRELPVYGAHRGPPAMRLRAAVFEQVALLRYRDVVLQRIVMRRDDPEQHWVDLALTTDEAGRIHPTGWDAVDWEVKELWPIEKAYRERYRDFDAIMERTPLFDHLTEIGHLCGARGIRLVVLNSPVHPMFMELLPRGRRDYRRFVARLRDASRRAGALYFDPAGHGIGSPDLFRDTHHHNQKGFAWLTDRLAAFLVRTRLL
jgi:hypothetical protein